jgi:hypothetical protein
VIHKPGQVVIESAGALEGMAPGSRDWCKAIMAAMQSMWSRIEWQYKDWEKDAALLAEYHAWELFPEYGAHDLEQLEAVIAGVPIPDLLKAKEAGRQHQAAIDTARKNKGTVGKHGGDRKSDQGYKNRNGNLDPTPCEQRGNSSAYRTRKLRDVDPAIVERLEAGEFKSVAAAERAARGEEPHPPRKVPTPLEAARRAVARLPDGEWAKLVASESARRGQRKGRV